MPKVALVLGGGGLTGEAFEAGVLAALNESLGWDAREADLIVGTSAGARAGALLRAGLSPSDLFAFATNEMMSLSGAELFAQMEPLPTTPTFVRPSVRFPSRQLLASAARRPFSSRAGLIAAALPHGPVSTGPFVEALRRLTGTTWCTDGYWAVAARLPTGERVAFGRVGAVRTDMALAVAASCAVPGMFAPVTIDGARYIDGGFYSPTNADLLQDEGFDTVVIVSPMSTTRADARRRRDPVRALCGLVLAKEVRKLRKAGAEVIVFQPCADEQRGMGINGLSEARRPQIARAARDAVLKRLDGGRRDDVAPLAA